MPEGDVLPGDVLPGDVYGRPLATALARAGVGAGWKVADVGAGTGEVAAALVRMVGPEGRVYAVDHDLAPAREVAAAAGAPRQLVVLTQRAEDLALPEPVDLAYCRFLLLHVQDPCAVLAAMRDAVRPGGWVVVQEPVTSAGRVDGLPLSMPDALHPDVGALVPALVRRAGMVIEHAWAESEAGAGPGPVASYLEALTGVDPGDDAVVLPPLVTVVARRDGSVP